MDASRARGGWESSAEAWIATQGAEGDWLRQWVLDPVVEELVVAGRGPVLDVGCGEGRFARRLTHLGLTVVGLDPVVRFASAARSAGTVVVVGDGEHLPFVDASFSTVLSYITLVDIPDFRAAIREMERVLAPGGRMVIATISAFATTTEGWVRDSEGNRLYFPIDRYLAETEAWYSWKGVNILNYHRPLSAYMEAFLGAGLVLSRYLEPPPRPGTPEEEAAVYRRVPYGTVMVWEKPM